MVVRNIGLVAFAAWSITACGTDATRVAEMCTESDLIAQCPVGTQALLEASAVSQCDAALEGGLIETGGAITGACEGVGSCRVLCEFANPCQCGVASLSREGVLCNQCDACGNGICDANETPDNCEVDCGERCVPGTARCDGDLIQSCTLQSIWEPARDCQAGLVCREDGDSAVCTGLATCQDNLLNGSESDADCGGACPTRCGDGQRCGSNADCGSRICAAGVCASSICGDGVVQDGEICDDGSANSDSAVNACRTTCQAHYCGDGVKDTNELCDDGNTDSGDGCASTCQIEQGYVCQGQPSYCATACGDGIKAGTEVCDDGNNAAGDHCAFDCSTVTGRCGDLVLQDNEVCDDGNTNAGDGCSSDCLSYTGECGNSTDGSVEPGEICDDGNQLDGDYCSSSCRAITGRCGDGIIQRNEACDDGNNAGGDYCEVDCSAVTGSCGDSKEQVNEACDFGLSAYCSTTCQAIQGACGDGIVQPWLEACDENAPFFGAYCSGDCTAVCGDQVRDPSETCDGLDTLAACTDYGDPTGVAYGTGLISCGEYCQSQTELRCTPQIRLALGTKHTCFAKRTGEVVCWGDDAKGQSTPPYERFAQLTAILDRTFGLKRNGDLAVWPPFASSPPSFVNKNYLQIDAHDANFVGVKSDGTLESYGPIYGLRVPPPGEYVQAAVGVIHACAVTTSGDVVCWGGTTTGAAVAPVRGVDLPADDYFVQVAAGDTFSCGLLHNGEVVCWGDPSDGRIDPPRGPFDQLVAHEGTACAIRSNGALACWGAFASPGEKLAPPRGVYTQIALGGDRTTAHACALQRNGLIHCWGDNDSGQLDVPQVQSLDSLSDTVCAHLLSGRIYCWGESTSATVGIPNETFEQFSLGWGSGGSPWRIGCGIAPSGVTQPEGTPTCWGELPVPATMPSGTFLAVAVQGRTTAGCGIRPDHTIECWDLTGQPPVFVTPPPTGTFDVMDGGGQFCGIKTDGSIACWGGEVGSIWPNGGVVSGMPPSGNNFVELDMSWSLACARRSTGQVECWGNATQLPMATYTLSAVYHRSVCGLVDNGDVSCADNIGMTSYPGPYEDVAVGLNHLCALRPDRNSVTCFGTGPAATPPTLGPAW